MKRFHHNDAELVKFVNMKISELTQLQHTPLGPTFSELTFEECEQNLILYRMSKKFEAPDNTAALSRRKKTLEAVLSYDEQGLTSFSPQSMVLCPYVRKQLYEVRNQMRHHSRSYVYDVRSLEITSGETLVSADGDTSLLAKLRDRTQWCVTPDCFELFADIAWKHPAIKRQVKHHFKGVLLQFGPWHPASIRRMNAWLWNKHKGHSKPAYQIFKEKLRKVVTFVSGARFTTVPKNNKVDRVIECEAMCNMIVQRVIANGIRNIISTQFGIDLNSSQDLHKKLITDVNNATIDLANASNSVWVSVVKWMIGDTRVERHVMASRSAVVNVEDELIHLNMVAPMGNGFTFELMTWLLLEFSRNLDSFAHVYGDDIIIDKDVAPDLIDVLNAIGFSTNIEKTFIHGDFRESCGGFTHKGLPILSYEFTWASDLFEALINVNKLRNLIYTMTHTVVRKQLERAYHEIVASLPLLCLSGGDPADRSLTDGVIIDTKRLMRLHRKCNKTRALYQKMVSKHRDLLKDLQLNHVYVRLAVTVATKTYRKAPTHVSDPHWVSYYLYNGRVSAPSYRRTQLQTKFVICEVGSVIPLT